MSAVRSVMQWIGLWLAMSMTVGGPVQAETLRVMIGHSIVLETPFKVASIAVGTPAIARATPVSATDVLVNGVAPGTTSMLVFDKQGRVRNYRVLVTHDLSFLQSHLWQLDRRLRVESDPNGDGVILAGIAASKTVAERAAEAAYRYFGEVDVQLQMTPKRSDRLVERRRTGRDGRTSNASTEVEQTRTVDGAGGDSTSMMETITQGRTRVINLIVTEEALIPAAGRLEALLKEIDAAITVQEVNGVYVLKGKVASPSVISRAVSLADRFVENQGDIDIKVFSDRGGVLAGNLDGAKVVDPVADILALPRALVGGRQSVRQGGFSQSGSASSVFLPTELSDGKGNLAQNIARGDVVVAAGGRVVSMLTLTEQPRVEIKMNIVAIDRTRTDKLGINWRLDGSRVSIDTTGAVIGTPPNATLTVLPELEVGGLSAVGKFATGFATVQSFVQALKQRGIAQSVSEPLLTAVSGESSSFLVGGNVPVPVQTVVAGNATQNNLVVDNIDFLEFGLRIVVRPTVTENGQISIVLDQTLTEPDRATSIVFRGVQVPGFKQRSVRTLTQSADSETWAVAGLVSDVESTDSTAVPLLSQIPVLGALFRNKSDEKSRSELIVTVTARRVGFPASGTNSVLPDAGKVLAPASKPAWTPTADDFVIDRKKQ